MSIPQFDRADGGDSDTDTNKDEEPTGEAAGYTAAGGNTIRTGRTEGVERPAQEGEDSKEEPAEANEGYQRCGCGIMGGRYSGIICPHGSKHGSRCGDNGVRRTNSDAYKELSATLFGPTVADPVPDMSNRGAHGRDDTESDDEDDEGGTRCGGHRPTPIRHETNLRHREHGLKPTGPQVLRSRRGHRGNDSNGDPSGTVCTRVPERSGAERTTPNRTRKCTALKTGQVVVYFWRKPKAEGDAEGYSIGDRRSGGDGGGEGGYRPGDARQEGPARALKTHLRGN
jgi:hypothetical protein